MKISLIGGEDTYSSQQKLNSLTKKFKQNSTSGEVIKTEADEVDSFKDLSILNGEMGLFSQDRLFILKNVINSAKKSFKDELSDFLKEKIATDSPNLEVILYENNKFDKRSKIYKFFKKNGQLIEYPAAKEADKKKFIKSWFKENNISINSRALEILLKKLLPISKLMIANELEKLRLLLLEEERNILEVQDLDLINQDIEEEIWELFKLGLNDKTAALDLLDNLFNQRIHFSVIIGFLSSQLRQIIDYKFDQTSLSPFIRRKISSTARAVDISKLNSLVERLVKLDISLKSSRLDPKLALTVYISSI
jgi:DNA polymerase-3 subunit delta